MITEDYISFETAKLMKEKGFNEYCRAFRSPSSIGSKGLFYSVNEVKNIEEKKTLGSAVACPTLQMAMKWLRKKHNLAISTSVTVDGWSSYVSQIKLDSEGFVVDIIDGIDDGNIPNCNTYEQACEAAIKYCLENLI